jgi:hypothetical protein
VINVGLFTSHPQEQAEQMALLRAEAEGREEGREAGREAGLQEGREAAFRKREEDLESREYDLATRESEQWERDLRRRHREESQSPVSVSLSSSKLRSGSLNAVFSSPLLLLCPHLRVKVTLRLL